MSVLATTCRPPCSLHERSTLGCSANQLMIGSSRVFCSSCDELARALALAFSFFFLFFAAFDAVLAAVSAESRGCESISESDKAAHASESSAIFSADENGLVMGLMRMGFGNGRPREWASKRRAAAGSRVLPLPLIGCMHTCIPPCPSKCQLQCSIRCFEHCRLHG